MSEKERKREKNAQYYFSIYGEVFKCLVLADQNPKKSVYNDTKQRKTANPHIHTGFITMDLVSVYLSVLKHQFRTPSVMTNSMFSAVQIPQCTS